MDIYWRESFTCPSEEDYLKMIRFKTGGLFGLGVQLMQLFSDDKRDYSKLVTLLGSYFQIRDDYVNLKSDDYAKNKSFCEDLTEGKFSFPILYGINSKPDDPTLINIVRQRTSELEIKKFAVQLMEKHGCFEYTLNYLRKLHEDSRVEIESLGSNPYMIQIIELFSKTV
ncbi:geranylgeranyl pyrophosphate synthase-like protein, partial [Leptotrombidium deliense]